MNTTHQGGVAVDLTVTPDAQVSENVRTLMHRTKMRQHQLGAAVGISPQTMSRRLDGKQPWAFWEVQAIASFFDVTLEELAGTLPSLGEYAVRHQGLEPRTRCFGGNSKPGSISGGVRGLRLLGGTNPVPALRVVA